MSGEGSPFAPAMIDVAAARDRPGLRLVVQQMVPNPWSESAKAITYVKRIEHVRVARVSRFAGQADANAALRDWAGMDCAPIAMWNAEPPRDHWARILNLCERLEPEPPLIPANSADRAAMFGLCHEICDENGFGWNRRLIFLRESERKGDESLGDLQRKYGAGGDLDAVFERIASILSFLAATLRDQRDKGSSFFIGSSLTAADIYWACFSLLVRPPEPPRCALDDSVRTLYTLSEPSVVAALDPILLDHRDFIYDRYLELPITV